MKLKSFLLKSANIFLSGMLFLLGFSTSCENDAKYEYGAPHADFIVQGTVKSGTTNLPVQQIKVKMDLDSTYTDITGRYYLTYSGMPRGDTILVQFLDIDGEMNGEFQQSDTIVDFSNNQFSGGDGKWYLGITFKEVDVKLTEKH
jgi:putative lipoprotein (rSAM/lipoprotein system)